MVCSSTSNSKQQYFVLEWLVYAPHMESHAQCKYKVMHLTGYWATKITVSLILTYSLCNQMFILCFANTILCSSCQFTETEIVEL